MKVLFHYESDAHLDAAISERNTLGLNIVFVDQDDPATFAKEIRTADVLWHVLAPVTADHLACAPNLKLIQKIGVGINTIDLDAARQRGVAVCNMPGTNTQAVTEMTLMLMLAALRLQPRMDTLTRNGAWRPDATTRAALGEVGRRTVGLVGFGAVPKRLAPVLDALGANVVYASRTASSESYQRLSLDELIAQADIVSLHLPLTESTQGLMSRERLFAMKPGSVLINTARGGLVDEAAFVEALQTGPLSAAGVDVFAEEPAPANHPLFGMDQVVVTPHAAWLTTETLDRSLDVAFSNAHAIAIRSALAHQVT